MPTDPRALFDDYQMRAQLAHRSDAVRRFATLRSTLAIGSKKIATTGYESSSEPFIWARARLVTVTVLTKAIKRQSFEQKYRNTIAHFGQVTIWVTLVLLWSTLVAAKTVSVSCPKDGTTDATPCIQATLDTLPANSELMFDGGNYLINSGVLQPGNIFCGVTSTIDGLTITGTNGATITSGPVFAGGGSLFCPTDTATGYERATTINYAIASAVSGSYHLTLVHPADRPHFEVGHVIYIHGETSDYNDRGTNVIKEISGATLTLFYPLGKDYTDNPRIADVDAFTRRNITVSNLTWKLNGAYAFLMSEVLNGSVVHNKFDNPSMFEDIGIGYVNGYRYEWNTLNESCEGLDLSSRGTSHIIANGNVIKLAGCMNKDVAGIGVGEGAEYVLVANNTIEIKGGNNEEGIDVTAAHTTVIYRNNIHIQHGGSAGGIVLDNGAPAQFVVPSATFMFDNTIFVDSGVGLRIQGGEMAGIGNRISTASGVVMDPPQPPPVWMIGACSSLIIRAGISSLCPPMGYM
jgi:hypothetical protein